jgi:hypothetical protein
LLDEEAEKQKASYNLRSSQSCSHNLNSNGILSNDNTDIDEDPDLISLSSQARSQSRRITEGLPADTSQQVKINETTLNEDYEQLNRINLELEQNVENLKNQLVHRDHVIQQQKEQLDKEKERFNDFKSDYKLEMTELLEQKFKRQADIQLDSLTQSFYLKEKRLKNLIVEYEARVRELQEFLNEKCMECDSIRQREETNMEKHKNITINRISSLIERLLAKNDIIDVSIISLFLQPLFTIFFY